MVVEGKFEDIAARTKLYLDGELIECNKCGAERLSFVELTDGTTEVYCLGCMILVLRGVTERVTW